MGFAATPESAKQKLRLMLYLGGFPVRGLALFIFLIAAMAAAA
jgi:hypothetical protein